MTGYLSRIVTKLKNVGHPGIFYLHTALYIENNLKRKKMSPELHEVLSNAIDIIKEIQHKAFNSRTFEELWEEFVSEYTDLRRAGVRWL
ncbi:DUF4371 domain-containing protein [Trichonephila clavipes]|nr:DUF4371 domain-containing protein [Trichonephila clavipes]